MPYFDDEPEDPALTAQFELWAGARGLDENRVRAALAAGAPPEPVRRVSPHGYQSPLYLAVIAYEPALRSGVRDRVVDALLEARTADTPLPLEAVVAAFKRGDGPMLDRLLPFLPEGIEQELPGVYSFVGLAVQWLDQQESVPAGRLQPVERLTWVLAHSPRLDHTHEQWDSEHGRTPLQLACREWEFNQFSRRYLLPAYASAISQLLAAGAPIEDQKAIREREVLKVLLHPNGEEAWVEAAARTTLSAAQMAALQQELPQASWARFQQALLTNALNPPHARQGSRSRSRLRM